MYVLPRMVFVTYKSLRYRCTEDATLQGVCEVVLVFKNTKYFKGVKFYVMCD
jgi:hypothetical protein